MTNKPGPRELALRAQREAEAKQAPRPQVPPLPKTSGKKPVKRKKKP